MDSIRNQSSSRKDKTLCHIVTRFVEVYNRNDGDPIGIDQAASRLGADKRRISDIVKLFECIGLVEKSGKSYVWKGFEASIRVLSQLKDEGMKENFANVQHVMDEERKERSIPDLNSEMGIYEEEDEESFNVNDPDDQETSKSPQPGTSLINNKKWKIALNIVKFFLCSDDGVIITIKDLTNALLNDESEDPPIQMKSKVRLLYDPINVLSSISLIEKINTSTFRWIGPKLIADSESSKKRASAIEMSNLNNKKNKTKCSDLEAEATNITYEGSANESHEVMDAEPISTIYPTYFYNPEDRWIMRNQSLQMDLGRFEDALRSSQKDFDGK